MELSIKTLNGTLKSFGSMDLNELNQSLSEFANLPETKDTVDAYLGGIQQLNNQIDSLKNVGEDQKGQFKAAFSYIASVSASDECRGIIIARLGNENQKLTEIVNKLFDLQEQDRKSYNELARKYKEKEKDELIELPGISLSITTKSKPLTNKECADVYKAVITNEGELEAKFKRVSVKNRPEFPNKVDRVYAKKDDVPTIIQKAKKTNVCK